MQINRATSILTFYQRRIRRIFPALYAMIIAVTIVSWILFFPIDFKEYGESVSAVSVFASNFYFPIRGGYFDVSSELRPLLHTWSLGVEEQFYVVFPVLLFAIFKFGFQRSILAILAFFWLVSFGLSCIFLPVDQEAVFYFPWFRAWELLTGSLIAFVPYLGFGSIRTRPLVSGLGLALIVLPILLYNEDTPFPAYSALAPVIGAAMIILGGCEPTNPVARGLQLRPVVYIGKISYSLYLWHWPPLVFARYLFAGSPPTYVVVIAVALAFIMAILSYHFVEQPFRRTKASTAKVIVAGIAVIMVAFPLGASAYFFKGMPWRLPTEVAAVAAVAGDTNPRRDECEGRSPSQIEAGELCTMGAKDAVPSFALVGDSFADAFMPGVAAAAEDAGTSGYAIARGGCMPLAGTRQGGDACQSFKGAAFDFVAGNPDIKNVILVARWSAAFEASRFGADKKAGMWITDPEHSRKSLESNRQATIGGLERTLRALKDKSVFIVAFIPEQRENVPRSVGLAMMFDGDTNIAVSRDVFEERQDYARRSFRELSERFEFELIDFGAVLCNDASCPGAVDGLPLFIDNNHVSRTTALKYKSLFADAVSTP